MGLVIHSLTLDGTTTNVATVRQLGCTLDPECNNMKPYFTTKANDGNDGKIYVWFDPCHMLKLLRNTLHDYGLLMSPTGRIEFSTLSRLLALQETIGLRLANKLTTRHISYQNQKMKVRILIPINHILLYSINQSINLMCI